MIFYTHERNFGCRVTEYVYRGLRTFSMENELLRVTVLADKGGDIIEFLHKPTDTDFMWRSPQGVRNPATFVPTVPRPEGSFLDYYEGGWQDCLPTGGGPARYGGTSFGPHGDVCLIPWDYVIVEDDPEQIAVRLRVRTYRTPLLVEKTLRLQRGRPVLTIEERLLNEGREAVELMWGHHPAFGPPFLDESCVIDLPQATVQTTDLSQTHRYRPGQGYRWPIIPGRDGAAIDLSRIPTADVGTHDTIFLTGLAEGWYAITNTAQRVGFALAWPVEVFPALWFWQVYGGAFGQPWYGRAYTIALEPWTTAENQIEAAVARGCARRLEPGEALAATLTATAYAGLRRIERVSPQGEVRGSE